MRIVHVAHHFVPELGYAEYYLAKKQLEIGHEVYVVTSHNSKSAHKRETVFFDVEGIKVISLPRFIDLADNVFVQMSHLKTVLTNLSPQIIHSHGSLSPFASMAILCKDDIGCKVVADFITGRILAEGPSLAIKTFLLKTYRLTLLPRLLKEIDCFLANSEAAMNWIQKEVGINRSKVHFIPLGADSDLFRFDFNKRKAVRERLGFNDNDVVAIYTGKLLPYKKLDTLLYASAPLIRTRDNFRILYVGGGSNQYTNYLKLIVNHLNISPSVLFHPAVHRTELPSFYSAADFAIWPGHHSISIIEAMSTGLPIIIPQSEWMDHLLKFENGFSYAEGDVAGLRKCIHVLLDNVELRREMGKRSRKLVEKELSWNNIAEEYLRIYNSLLEGRLKL